MHVIPLKLAALEPQLASITGKCDRHYAILQHGFLNRFFEWMLRRREFKNFNLFSNGVERKGLEGFEYECSHE